MLRRCAGTRSWEKRWQREKPQQVLRPTSNPPHHHPDPEEHTPLPAYPTCPHLSTPAILPHTTMKVPQPEMPPRDSGRFEWGWGWIQKCKNNWKKEKEKLMSTTHSSQKKECFCSVSNEKKRKKSNWHVTVGIGFCKYFFFCYIQYDTSSKSIDCSVPFLYISFLSLHIWM